MRNPLVPNGDAIRALRQLKGWDLRTFAGRVEISESHLGNVERGLRGLAAPKLKRVADELGVPIGAITTSREHVAMRKLAA